MTGALAAQRTRTGTTGWCVLIATTIALAYAASQRDFGPAGYWIPLLALLLALLCLAPSFARSLGFGRARPIPFLALIGAIHLVYYALPPLVADRVGTMTAQIGSAEVETALLGALLGVAMLLAGYFVFGSLDAHARPARLDWDPARAVRVAWWILPVGVVCHALDLVADLPGFLVQPVRLLAQCLPVALGVLFVLARRGHLPRGLVIVVFYVLAPLLLFSQIADASIGYAVRTGIFFLMLVWGTGGRVSVLLLVFGAFAAATLRSGAEEFRSLEQHHPHLVSESPLERAGQFVGLSVARIVQDGGASAGETMLDRVSQIALLGHVMAATPQVVPLWNGATYATLPASVVPRVLWPNKPAKELGQTFGHRYGILDAEDSSTSVNLPQLVEFYANFGWAGIALGCALLGAFYRWLSDRLNRSGAGDGGIVLAALLFSTLTNVESDASLVLGGMAQIGAVFWIVIASTRRSVRTAPLRLAGAAQ